MFLDESGDHSLTKIDPQYPVFVLAGAVFDAQYHDQHATPVFNKAKADLFGRADIIIHTADLTRNRSPFEAMKEPSFA